ncbi:NAD-dependent epimerase/dehydratase family protein [Microlunatus antarcticus]|uniref:Nucleoside-diphosphate-sugar epimerase n=1 Tax=Microlunatus antarcticus TaxID=53388 RepID=A0A7W5JTD3_9ACTN|nr:NAD(P)-dependent oxidoreductase [Microlunatus antarcticus]MBB3325996.1 nucleoside-diphosphate-sugar epimerase [Microlunatus antarcticus]
MPDTNRTTTRRRVVVTGAAGRIGRALAGPLDERWDVLRTDLPEAADAAGIAPLDVTDLEACRAAFADADAVVHLAADPGPGVSFDELHGPNLVGPYAVAQAAADVRVRRLVLASSLHAMSALPASVQRRTSDQPRPGNLYGAAKAWSEGLGAWIAATTGTSVVALRIGYFSEQRPGPDTLPQDRTAWLSTRDAVELVRASVEADLPAGVDGFVVAHGVSANRHNVAELGATRRDIGYVPVDDAWSEE